MRFPHALVLVACLFTAASRAEAGVVFSSGTLPDLTDIANFDISDNLTNAGSYNHTVLPAAVPAPVTVRAVEFYGFSEGINLLGGDPDHGFELIFGGGVNVVDVERVSVGPPLATPLPGGFATDVRRIQIDITPTTFSGGQVLIRGTGGAGAEFWMARAAPAIADIELAEYSDSNLTSLISTTFGEAFFFNFYDEFLVAPSIPGDFDGDGYVGLSDLNILGGNFGAMGAATPLDGDANGDGNVDLADLNILGGNWNPPPATSIPEPASVTLVAFALLCGIRASRS